MNTTSVLKKRIILFSFSVIFILVCLLITYYFNANNSKNNLVVNKKNIQVVYENAKKGINTSDYPLKYEEGKKNSPSNIIKIRNKIETNINYEIVITTDKEDNNSLDPSKIYVSINSGEGKVLSSIAEGIVYTSMLGKKEEESVDLKIWISDELIEVADNGKSLGINVEVREK